MINIENTTAAERDIIANAMSPVMETILSAGRLLSLRRLVLNG